MPLLLVLHIIALLHALIIYHFIEKKLLLWLSSAAIVCQIGLIVVLDVASLLSNIIICPDVYLIVSLPCPNEKSKYTKLNLKPHILHRVSSGVV